MCIRDRIINNEIVSKVLNMKDCIRVQEEAFKKIPKGGAIHRPRIDMYMPCDREDGYFRWGTMEGANDGFFAIRMKSDVIYWPENESGNWTEEKFCREPGTYCGMVLIISTRNAEPLAFINDGHIQHMRVGGGAGIGVKYLSRENSNTVGMLGSGGMARTFLEAFCCVREITKCKVYSPTKSHREAYAQEMGKKLSIEVVAVDNPAKALQGADIVATCTDTMSPTIKAEWLEPGMHVTDLCEEEIDDSCLTKIDIKIRQGEGGLPLPEQGRIKRLVGHSPVAYIAGTAEEMKRLPNKPNATPKIAQGWPCLLYTSPSPRDATLSRMPSSA